MLPFDPSPNRFKPRVQWLSFLSAVPESRLVPFVRSLLPSASLILLVSLTCLPVMAQTDEFGDSAADAVKLFERGQGAHARGEFEKAIEFYTQAIKVRPEFPEAEFQRGNALVSLSRFDEAEAAFRQAIQLKKTWALPYSALGSLLMRLDRDDEATPVFRQALAVDANENIALRLLSEIRLRAGDTREALELARRATQNQDAPSSAWIGLAIAEKASGNKEVARKTLDRLLSDEPNNIAALLERSDLSLDDKSYESAITDLKLASQLRPKDKAILSRLAYAYQQAGRSNEANEVAKAAGLEVKVSGGDDKNGVIGTPEEIAAANNEDPTVARQAIEKLIEKNPRNAMLLARLGASFRKENPVRSLELYRRASELQPSAPEHAVGYAAALVQARRFVEAAAILQRVIKLHPQNYSAHANLATALYESKQYSAAVTEFEWLLANKPDAVVAHYFIATSHDYLGEYPEALASYERFLATADAKTNQLEIEKVNLRLPTLRRQIQLGEGVKKKP
jgi:tetratricopeptide (TPR) repeat protein